MRERHSSFRDRLGPGCRLAALALAITAASAVVSEAGAADISGYIEARDAARAAAVMEAEAGEFQTRARAGDADAQFRLGQALRKGHGIPMDSIAAATWLREAADHGHADAQNALGEMYERGEGVPQSDARALHWYGKAADQGQTAAQVALATLIVNSGSGKLAEAYVWFERAAAAGNANAVRGALALEPLIPPEEIADARQRVNATSPSPTTAVR